MSKAFKKPDLNATRVKVKRSMLDPFRTYLKFIKKYPEYSKYTQKDCTALFKKLNGLLWQTAINHRDGVELPENTGTIFIGSCKSLKKRENINYGKSIKYNTTVTNTNLMTDGYVGKIFYTNYKEKYTFKYRQFWSFKGTRDFKRALGIEYLENWKRYKVVDGTKNITQQFNKKKRIEYLRGVAEKNLESYNDFDI